MALQSRGEFLTPDLVLFFGFVQHKEFRTFWPSKYLRLYRVYRRPIQIANAQILGRPSKYFFLSVMMVVGWWGCIPSPAHKQTFLTEGNTKPSSPLPQLAPLPEILLSPLRVPSKPTLKTCSPPSPPIKTRSPSTTKYRSVSPS